MILGNYIGNIFLKNMEIVHIERLLYFLQFDRGCDDGQRFDIG